MPVGFHEGNWSGLSHGSSTGLVFSPDFPHDDSKFPESIDRFLQLDISAEEKRKILWDNCAAYYGIAG